jgi:hypothetical protein
MTVLVTLLAKGDSGELERYAQEHADRMREILERAKGHGLISHRFYGKDGAILVVDEWETAEGFTTFFDSSPDIGEMMAEVGVTAPPEQAFWRELDTRDSYQRA